MTNITNIKEITAFLEIKKCRELLCRNYVEENPIITEAIIDYWKLNRIDDKYRKQIRVYDENSYSKRKIKEEEITFLHKQLLFQPLRYYFEEQRVVHDELFKDLEMHENYEVDDTIYRRSILERDFILDYPQKPYIIRKNNRDRIDMTARFLEVPEVREQCINQYLSKHRKYIEYLIETYKLKFLTYKYINNSLSKFESSYTRNKIKQEETFLINKVYLFSIWFRRMEVFWDLRICLFSQSMVEKENRSELDNIYFLEIVVNSIINEFRKVDFDIAQDINLN